MTVVERKQGARAWATEYTVSRLYDRDEIRRLLETKRPYAAYALGQLDPIPFKPTEGLRTPSA